MIEKQTITKEGEKAVLTEGTVIWFGKHKGLPVTELAVKEPEFMLVLNRSRFFKLSTPVLTLAVTHVPRNHFLLKPWQEPVEDWRSLITKSNQKKTKFL